MKNGHSFFSFSVHFNFVLAEYKRTMNNGQQKVLNTIILIRNFFDFTSKRQIMRNRICIDRASESFGIMFTQNLRTIQNGINRCVRVYISRSNWIHMIIPQLTVFFSIMCNFKCKKNTKKINKIVGNKSVPHFNLHIVWCVRYLGGLHRLCENSKCYGCKQFTPFMWVDLVTLREAVNKK